MTASAGPRLATPASGLVAVVGFLVCVEVASGVLQGFYTPVWREVADHLGIRAGDVNWFEAAQLIVSALAVPFLARLGDIVGHKRVLLIATAATALGSWILVVSPTFTAFLVGYAIQGAYVVWLPLEVAIVYRRTAGSGAQDRLTRRAAAILVVALYVAIIAASLASGNLADVLPVAGMLAIPAGVVTICLVLVWVGVEDRPGTHDAGFDRAGLALLTLLLGLVMAALIVIRVLGPGFWPAWLLLAAGIAVVIPFARYERRLAEPLIDVDLLLSKRQWPLQAASFLLGVSVLGAQVPLSTFARTDPAEAGYGLGLRASAVSILIAVYILMAIVGAALLPVASRILGPRVALIVAALLVGLGYGLFVPSHGSPGGVLVNMMIAGVGTGLLVAALPAAAASAAPADRTGFATGMTNTVKTVGGAIASAVFAISLASTGVSTDPAVVDTSTATPLSGYLAVWSICAVTAVLAGVVLAALPRKPAPAERA